MQLVQQKLMAHQDTYLTSSFHIHGQPGIPVACKFLDIPIPY